MCRDPAVHFSWGVSPPTGTGRGGLGEAGVFKNSADAQQQDAFQGGLVVFWSSSSSFFSGRWGGEFFRKGDVVGLFSGGETKEGGQHMVKKGCYEGDSLQTVGFFFLKQ